MNIKEKISKKHIIIGTSALVLIAGGITIGVIANNSDEQPVNAPIVETQPTTEQATTVTTTTSKATTTKATTTTTVTTTFKKYDKAVDMYVKNDKTTVYKDSEMKQKSDLNIKKNDKVKCVGEGDGFYIIEKDKVNYYVPIYSLTKDKPKKKTDESSSKDEEVVYEESLNEYIDIEESYDENVYEDSNSESDYDESDNEESDYEEPEDSYEEEPNTPDFAPGTILSYNPYCDYCYEITINADGSGSGRSAYMFGGMSQAGLDDAFNIVKSYYMGTEIDGSITCYVYMGY